MTGGTAIQTRLAFRKKAMEQAQAAYLALLGGQVKSYTIGSRNLTKLDLPQLEHTISTLEKEIDRLEHTALGGKPRKAIGVVPRDW